MDNQTVVCTYNGILFTCKKNEILIHAAIWIELNNILLSEIGQTRKDKYMIPLMWST